MAPGKLRVPYQLNKFNLTLTSAGVLENGLLVLLTFADVDDGNLVRLATSLRVLETNYKILAQQLSITGHRSMAKQFRHEGAA